MVFQKWWYGGGPLCYFIFFNFLHSLQEKYGPVGLVHLDAHPDTSKTTFGEKISNATPFRLATEEGLLDCERVVVIGLRGSGNSPIDYEYGRNLVRTQLISSPSVIGCKGP